MSSKRALIATAVALLGVAGAATTSIASLRAPAAPFVGCFQSCTLDTQCTNAKCPACTGAPGSPGICVSSP